MAVSKKKLKNKAKAQKRLTTKVKKKRTLKDKIQQRNKFKASVKKAKDIIRGPKKDKYEGEYAAELRALDSIFVQQEIALQAAEEAMEELGLGEAAPDLVAALPAPAATELAAEQGDDVELRNYLAKRSKELTLTTSRLASVVAAAEGSVAALRLLLQAFHVAVGGSEDMELQRVHEVVGRLQLDSEAASEGPGLIAEALPRLLAAHAGDAAGADKKEKKKSLGTAADGVVLDATRREKWNSVKAYAQLFFRDLAVLLEHPTAAPAAVLERVVRAVSSPEALAWLQPFPILRRRVLDALLRKVWAGAVATPPPPRLTAFLAVKNAAALAMHAQAKPDDAAFEALVHQALRAFTEATAHGPSWRSLGVIRFQEQCLVELLRMDDSKGFKVAHACLRELAALVRNGCVHGSIKEDRKKLLSWTFVRTAQFWTRAICGIPALKPLAQPLLMIVLGAVKTQLPTLANFPFVYHCLRCLAALASSLEFFLPLSSYLLKAFGKLLAVMEKAQKQRKSGKASKGVGPSVRAQDLEVLLKLSEDHIAEGPTADTIGGGLCMLFTEHLGFLSRSPAFPELTVMTLQHLRRHRKKCPSEPIRRQLQTLVDAVEAGVAHARGRRENLQGGTDVKKTPFLALGEDSPMWKVRSSLLKRVAADEKAKVEAETKAATDGAGPSNGAGVKVGKIKNKKRKKPT